MEAVKFAPFKREPKIEVVSETKTEDVVNADPDIYEGLVAAAQLIKQHTNGHLVKISMDTHDILSGVWNRKVVSQSIEFKVVITVNVKEEHQ